MQKMQKILVTGAGGFIGKHVIKALQDISGAQIIAASLHATTGAAPVAPVRFIQHDIALSDKDDFEKLGRPDVLLHLAWGGLPNYNSLHHFERELPIHYNFLKNLIEGGLKNVVVTGTCFEYGYQNGALSEAHIAQPHNPYAYAKDALRRQLEFLKTKYAFNFTWARLFYLYGEGQSEKSLLSQLAKAVDDKEPFFNMSLGEQLRDYLKAEEVAHALARLSLNPQDIGIVNICSGKPTSVRTLVEQQIEQNGWDIKLNRGHYPYPAYEPMAFWGDDTKMREVVRKNSAIIA